VDARQPARGIVGIAIANIGITGEGR